MRPSAHARRKAEPLREVAMSLEVLIEVVILLAPFRRGPSPGLDNEDRQVRSNPSAARPPHSEQTTVGPSSLGTTPAPPQTKQR